MIFVFVAYSGVPHSVISYVRTFSVPCCDVRIKRCSVRLCPQYFNMRAHDIFRQERSTLREHLVSFPVFLWGPFYFYVFCIVFFVFCFDYSLCLVYPMLSVSLDCPFTIGYSVFSSVYLHALVMKKIKLKY